MSSLNFNEDRFGFKEEKSSTKKPFRSIFAIGALIAVVTLGATFAASIRINSGGPVEFGQGMSAQTACTGDTSLSMTPTASFLNEVETSTFLFKSLTVSNIPTTCYGVDFTINAYGNSSDSTPLSLFNITSTDAVVYDNAGTFEDNSGSSGMSVTGGSGTFTITFDSPVAVSTTVYKVTIQSRSHISSTTVYCATLGGTLVSQTCTVTSDIAFSSRLTIPVGYELIIDGEATITNNGTLINNGTLTNNGTIDDISGQLTNSATFTNNGLFMTHSSTFLNNGTTTNNSGATINVNSGTITNNGTINNIGLITNIGAGGFSNSGTVHNTGMITNTSGGAVTNTGSGAVTGSGTITYAYAIGATGPSGGTIFYADDAGFSCGEGFSTTGSPDRGLCHYLEVAPAGWNTGDDPQKLWAVSTLWRAWISVESDQFVNNTQATIGLGYKQSKAIVDQGNDNTTAAGAARGYSGGTKSDWYLPNFAELNQLCQWNRGVTKSFGACAGGSLNSNTYGAGSAGLYGGYYWSSTQFSQQGAGQLEGAWERNLGALYQTSTSKNGSERVRPIRAF